MVALRSLSHLAAAVHPPRTAAAALLSAVALVPAGAQAYTPPSINPLPPVVTATSATVAASLSPDRLGGRGALTVTITYSGGELGVPSPVRHATIRFPAGLTLDIPKLESCSAARLQARGLAGCPSVSRLGSGHALALAHAGSQNLTENVHLTAFLGPLRGFAPTLLILAQGYTPLEERVVVTGELLPASPPYGEKMEIAIPAIVTLPLVPDASLATFSLTVGAGSGRRPGERDAVQVPSTCPASGFQFAAEFTYADAGNGSALATVPCPS